MKIYLIRHGETDFNRRGIVQGGGVDSDLNEVGKAQARAFFEAYRNVPFDAVYASSLKRTYQTIEAWADQLGFEIRIEPGLNEMSWGVLEGKVPTTEESKSFQQLKLDWQSGHLDRKVDGGESPNECWSRVSQVVERFRRDHTDQTILVCSHGRTGRVLLAGLLSNDLKEMEIYNHSNTGLNLLTWDEQGSVHVDQLNDTRHLETLGSESNESNF